METLPTHKFDHSWIITSIGIGQIVTKPIADQHLMAHNFTVLQLAPEL